MFYPSITHVADSILGLKGVPASLTLGGMDQNRYVQNEVSFDLSPDLKPIVALNSIRVDATPVSSARSKPPWSGPRMLLDTDNAGLFTIDSSTAFLWLPGPVCDAFAEALGLTYNNTLELYTYESNPSQREALISWNLTFTFKVADLPGSSKSVDLTLPYSAFDLKLSYPFPKLDNSFGGGNFSYFPLRRADNNTQYTIGRSFLQETYLIVDYERRNFSISQAKFAADATTNLSLVGIQPPGDTPSNSRNPTLSNGAKVGIGVGVALLAILICIFIGLWWRRRRRARSSKDGDQEKYSGGKNLPVSELPADRSLATEVPANEVPICHELPGQGPVELEGSEVASSFYGPDANKYNQDIKPSANDPAVRKLASREGVSAEVDGQNRLSTSTVELPPYSQIQRNNTNPSERSSAGISAVPFSSPSDGTRSMAMPSPVIPALGADGRPRSITGSSRGLSQSSTRQLEVPPSPPSPFSSSGTRPPRRTESDASRLVVEGLHNSSGSQHPQDDATLPRVARKFSWEL